MSRTVETVVYTDAGFQSVKDAERALLEASTSARPNRDGTPAESVKAAADELDKVTAKAVRSGAKVVCASLSSRVYRRLLRECPPRTDNEQDALVGFDVDAMSELLPYYFAEDGRSLAQPSFGTKAEAEQWLDALSFTDFQRVMSACVRANQDDVPDPKVSFASRLEQMSSATSGSPALTD